MRDTEIKIESKVLRVEREISYEELGGGIDLEDLRKAGLIETEIEGRDPYPEGKRLIYDPVVAGAIFDFAAFLTGRDEEIKFGGDNDCSIMVDEIRKWAELRGLMIDDPHTMTWEEEAGRILVTGAVPVPPIEE